MVVRSTVSASSTHEKGYGFRAANQALTSCMSRSFIAAAIWWSNHETACGDQRTISKQRAANQNALNVVGAFVNLRNTHIPVDALNGKIADVAVAAVNLDGIRAHLFGDFGPEHLGHRSFLQTRFSCILHHGGTPNHQPGRVQLGCHVCKPEADGLVLHERYAERSALLGIAYCRIEGGTGHANRLGGDTDATRLEVGQGDLVALPPHQAWRRRKRGSSQR